MSGISGRSVIWFQPARHSDKRFLVSSAGLGTGVVTVILLYDLYN